MTGRWFAAVVRGLSAAILLLAAGCGGAGPAPEPGAGAGLSNGPTDPSKGVFFVGFDVSPPLQEALAAGAIQGLVVQNPYKMGDLSVRTLVAHLEGKPVEKTISTGEAMVTPENMDSEEMKPLLNAPKLEHSANADPGGKKAKKWRIMVIPKGTTHEHWKTIHAGAAAAAKELGTVEIYWKGSQKEDDRTEQIALVQTAAQTGVDGIVLAPLDAEALVPAVEEVIAKGIPVVIMDSSLNSDKTVSYVATDNYLGGQLAGERMVELLKDSPRRNLMMMRYMVGSASTEQREKGFLDVMAKHPEINLISIDQYGGATSETAQKMAQSLAARHRGYVDAVFTPNESSTSGMLRALREAGMLVRRP
jgi:ribose transport system substrate-binding protein